MSKIHISEWWMWVVNGVFIFIYLFISLIIYSDQREESGFIASRMLPALFSLLL